MMPLFMSPVDIQITRVFMNTSIKLNLDEVIVAMEHSMPLYPKTRVK